MKPDVLLRLAASLGAVVALLGLAGFAPAAHADVVRDKQQPMLRALDVAAAWEITKGEGATVGLVDSGADPNQADIKGSVTAGPNFISEVDGKTRPKRLHGTGMASLIVGHGHGPGGKDGIIGIAPEARVLAVRALAEEEDASYGAFRENREAEGAVARGIRYVADHGVDVINLSLGKYADNAAEREAIAYAIGKGIVVVAAVGNDGDKGRRLDKDGFAPYSYPASYPGVIAVAATDSGHRRAPFSNRNYSVLVSAPGVGIPTAAPGGEYYLTDGTSDSSALVSGIAALIRARHPDMQPAMVAQALLTSTRFAPSGAYDAETGFGEVNAERALQAADRLTGASATGAGQSSGQRFVDQPPGPVTVIHRPIWMKAAVITITVLAFGGVGTAVFVAIVLYRRTRTDGGGPPPSPDGGPAASVRGGLGRPVGDGRGNGLTPWARS